MGIPVIKPSNISRCQAISDIIGSVACEQAALAHILNAEGEKIQKIVADSTPPQQILAVNRSVKDIVNSITMLEVVLKSKLALFENCLCEECPCTAILDTALSFIDLGDRTASIVKNNKNSYHVNIGGSNDLPISMLFATFPNVPVQVIHLPAATTFNDNMITVTGVQSDAEQVILEVGEGTCGQIVIIDINIGS